MADGDGIFDEMDAEDDVVLDSNVKSEEVDTLSPLPRDEAVEGEEEE